MSFLYPRTISVRRPNTNTAAGAQPYSGVQPINENVIVAGIAAHIEAAKGGAASPAGLPADTKSEPIFLVIFKIALGVVLDRDIIVDDLGFRYQVISSDWGPLVNTCTTKKLET